MCVDTAPSPSVETWYEHRVSYGETDAMGYVYYGEYLHIFERARGELIRSLGKSYADIEAGGIMLPVREARCRYRRPAHYDDLLRVHVRLGKQGGASLSFLYSVYDAEGKTLHAEGMTQHACAAMNTGSPVPMPPWLQALFRG